MDGWSASWRGLWEKHSAVARETRGKHLGIIGYGNIGAQLSVLAESLGMEVWYYDVQEKLALGNARPARSLRRCRDQASHAGLSGARTHRPALEPVRI